MSTPGVPADVLSDVYDAAVDPAAWRRLPALVRRLADGAGAVLWTSHADGFFEAVADNVPDEGLASYGSHYVALDPWLQAATERGVLSEAQLGTDLLSEREVRRTEFYVDFSRIYGTGQIIGACLQKTEGTVVALGVQRPLGGRSFDHGHRDRVQELKPHLEQVVRLRRRLRDLDSAGTGRAALEALAVGVVICDRGGRVLFANTAAETLAAGGDTLVLGPHDRPIGARRHQDGVGLLRLIANAAEGGPGGGLRLDGEFGARVFVLVSPLPDRFGAGPGRVLIVLRAADDPPSFGAGLLGRLFGLTPAEADVALALLSERSLAEIGEERSVTENTLRTQLSRVLHKTGTASQREVVRLLSQLPPVRPRREE